MTRHVVLGHRRFDRLEEWFDEISQYFMGARSARRSGPFLLSAHLNSVTGSHPFDVNAHQSGYRPGEQGFSIDGVATHRYFAIWQARRTSTIRLRSEPPLKTLQDLPISKLNTRFRFP
jgi:hypothetical protein